MTALQLLAYIAAAIGLQSLLAVAILIWRRNPPEAVRVTPVVSSRTSEAAWDGLRPFRAIARTYEDPARTVLLCTGTIGQSTAAAVQARAVSDFLAGGRWVGDACTCHPVLFAI